MQTGTAANSSTGTALDAAARYAVTAITTATSAKQETFIPLNDQVTTSTSWSQQFEYDSLVVV